MDAQLARTVESDVAMLTGKAWLAPTSEPEASAQSASGRSAAVQAFEQMADDHRALGSTSP